MNYTVKPDENALTVKEYLSRLGISSRFLRQLKANPQGILLNGVHCTVRAVLTPGDILSVALEDDTSHQACSRLAPPLPPVLYEDEDLLVIDKPAGMPTHPSFRHRGDTLADAVLAMEHAPAVFRAVTRLDKDTSGITLIARNQLVASFLSGAMAAGKIQKEYIALIDAPIVPSTGKMVDHIARERDSIIRRTVNENGEGDRAETDYETVAIHGKYTLVRLYPHTGRTHQLRVQLASRGCPIVGDGLYGGTPVLPRQALHACRLQFPHPKKGLLCIESNLPSDICGFFEKESI